MIVPLFAAGLASGQFATGVNLVEVYATVTDARGEPVTGLTAADFQVSEDGTVRPITTFASGEFPLTVAIALDRSFSMAGERLSLARRAAAAFIGALRDEDQVMVLAIGSDVETITPMASAREAARTAWQAIEPWGTTPLYDAADAAIRTIDAIPARRGRRALLLISDGADRGSHTTAADLIDHARRTGVLVYPVAIAKARPPVFAELAGVTGGRSLQVSDPTHLDSSLIALAHELRTQYLLGYVPPDGGVPGRGWHAIDVRVDRPGARVRARDGYAR